MRELKRQLLKSREYRDAYAEGFLRSFLSGQLMTLRERLGWSQDELAQKSGVPVQMIRWCETDGERCSINLQSLVLIAQAMGYRVRVSFETFGSLLEECAQLDADKMLRPAIEEDPSFVGLLKNDPTPEGEMRRKMVSWLQQREWDGTELINWLQGYDLPPVGDEVPPHEWLTTAAKGLSLVLIDELKKRVANVYGRKDRLVGTIIGRPKDFLYNLERLCSALAI